MVADSWHHKNAERISQTKHRRVQGLIDWVDGIKADTPCADCNQRFPAVCMDFDHVRGEKKQGLSQMVQNGRSRRAILEEMFKCDLVCSNCHRIRTWKSGRATPWTEKLRKYDRSSW